MNEIATQPRRFVDTHHDQLGATIESREGLDVPIAYRGTALEIEALSTDLALVDRSWIGRLRMSGADRLSFLQRYVTQDVASLDPESGAYGFVTNPKGGILADFALIGAGDEIWLELPYDAQEAVAEHLGTYALFDQVDISPLDDRTPLTVAGPKAAAWLAEVLDEGAVPTAPWQTGAGRLAGIDVRLADRPLLGVPAISLWVATDEAPALIEAFDSLPKPSTSPKWAGWDAIEAVRIAAGIPRHGIDYGENNLPQETGLEDSTISYTKGCYLGQEVVARIHYRGRVNRVPVGLAFDHDPTPGTELRLDDRPVGTIGSVTKALADRPMGLAIVHRKAAEIGTTLTFEGGENSAEAQVIELPINRS